MTVEIKKDSHDEIDSSVPGEGTSGDGASESGSGSSEVKAVIVAGDETPKCLSQGTYAIYQTPEGGWHIAYLPSDTPDTQHFEIPAMAVQLFQAMQRGEMPSPISMMKKMMKHEGMTG